MRPPRPWILPTDPATAAVLLSTGVSEQMIRTALSRGELRRLRQGVFVAARAWPPDARSQHIVLARAELAANPQAVISHQSAAAIWELPHPGFDSWHERPPAITSPVGTGHRSRPGIVERHGGDIPSALIDKDPAGYRVTGLARTAVDLTVSLPLPDQLVVLDAVARRLVAGFVADARRRDFTNPRLIDTARELIGEAASAARRTSLLDPIGRAHPARESAAESLTAGHLFLSGLPEPEYQVPIRTPAGVVFPDFLWRGFGAGVIGECDGAVKYSGPQATVAERQRQELLESLGFIVVRWLAKEIMVTP